MILSFYIPVFQFEQKIAATSIYNMRLIFIYKLRNITTNIILVQ